MPQSYLIKFYLARGCNPLFKLWKFFLRICGERLVPLLRANLDSISRKQRFRMSPEGKQKLSTISRATAERLLAKEREKYRLKGKSTTKKGNLLKNQISVRVFWAWDEKQPGFYEIDTVSHDRGGEIRSYYAWTVTVTDVALGWAEVRALKNKAQRWTLEATCDTYDAFSVPIRDIDSDGGSEFINQYFKNGATSVASRLHGEGPTIPTTTVSWSRRTATWSGKSSATPALRGTRFCPPSRGCNSLQ